MEYQYKIPTFEEALSISENVKGFSHSVQEMHGKEIHSFKYNISHKEMWEDLSDGRLNMRGITFIDGGLVCLPPWKFFNLNEVKFATYPEKEKYLMSKEDGSLISVFQVDNLLEVKTMKSVYSDVAIQARTYSDTRPDLQGFSVSLINKGLSPYFEFISPQNRIVLRYEKDDFVFLGARCMKTGKMFFPWDLLVPSTITIPMLITPEKRDEYLEREDVEGLVVVGEDGHMIKCKSATYCQLHKILDIKTKKSMCEYYIDHGNFDDVIGVLTHNGLHQDVADLLDFELAVDKYNHLSRKEIALKMIEDKVDKSLRGMVFSSLDGKEVMPKIKRLILDSYKDDARREQD
jgi:T4 RnlA family RNA ligase